MKLNNAGRRPSAAPTLATRWENTSRRGESVYTEALLEKQLTHTHPHTHPRGRSPSQRHPGASHSQPSHSEHTEKTPTWANLSKSKQISVLFTRPGRHISITSVLVRMRSTQHRAALRFGLSTETASTASFLPPVFRQTPPPPRADWLLFHSRKPENIDLVPGFIIVCLLVYIQ